MKPSDVLLHPLRLRIVQAFLGDRTLTTGELREELADAPSATLYRQVGVLADAGVLEVVGERKVRGALERSYRLRTGAASVGAQDAAAMSVEEHRQAFTMFVLALLEDYERYLARGDVDLARDLVGYRQAAMHLSDAELRDLLDDLAGVLRPRLELPPAPGRTRRRLSTVLLPDARPGT
ncbi:hypothetical protein FHR75_004465 [Kineococcus radiotolerans]|uniref:Regulatory protein ArsR n=1 Tax=Kineococcus radiotolerans TaxID=131568 RepID=A0A7W4TRF5_KINRA|nr:helix-turn-helix domain-containing protein [Kineococcus radiotolerans]MBB2903622.1 hypothetical protein [Kineococcus radiotolerans]